MKLHSVPPWTELPLTALSLQGDPETSGVVIVRILNVPVS